MCMRWANIEQQRHAFGMVPSLHLAYTTIYSTLLYQYICAVGDMRYAIMLLCKVCGHINTHLTVRTHWNGHCKPAEHSQLQLFAIYLLTQSIIQINALFFGIFFFFCLFMFCLHALSVHNNICRLVDYAIMCTRGERHCLFFYLCVALRTQITHRAFIFFPFIMLLCNTERIYMRKN